MSEATAAAETTQRQMVDTSDIVFETDVAIPNPTRSKYPWSRLITLITEAPDELHSFVIGFESEERANQIRGSIQASATNYLRSLELTDAYRITTRAMKVDPAGDAWGVRAWILPATSTVEDEADDDEVSAGEE